MLDEWRSLAEIVAQIIKKLVPSAGIYTFGGIITERVTGSSNLDILAAVSNNLNEHDAHIHLSMELEEDLGVASRIVDLRVV